MNCLSYLSTTVIDETSSDRWRVENGILLNENKMKENETSWNCCYACENSIVGQFDSESSNIVICRSRVWLVNLGNILSSVSILFACYLLHRVYPFKMWLQIEIIPSKDFFYFSFIITQIESSMQYRLLFHNYQMRFKNFIQ